MWFYMLLCEKSKYRHLISINIVHKVAEVTSVSSHNIGNRTFSLSTLYLLSTYRILLFYNSDRRSKRDIIVPRKLKRMKKLSTLYIYFHFRVQFKKTLESFEWMRVLIYSATLSVDRLYWVTSRMVIYSYIHSFGEQLLITKNIQVRLFYVKCHECTVS